MVVRRWALTGTIPPSRIGMRLAMALLIGTAALPTPPGVFWPGDIGPARTAAASAPTPVDNFTASINRLVELVALAGSGVLALVWTRVALSWFSNDVTKKIQAKDRAKDALIGTLLFLAAVTGLLYGLAQWVLTGV